MKLKKILLASILFAACFQSAVAQSSIRKLVYNRSDDNRLRYSDGTKNMIATSNKVALLHTTDSAYNNIDTIVIANNESGIIEVQVIGYNDSLSIAVTGKQIVRYKKVGGTLTMGTPANILAKETDTGLQYTNVGSTWQIIASNNNIYIQVKGRLTYNVYWESLRTLQKKVP